VSVLRETVTFVLEPHLIFHEALRGDARIRLLADHLATACTAFWSA
jgi:hypothetical protein